jgi:hypothetical protein
LRFDFLTKKSHTDWLYCLTEGENVIKCYQKNETFSKRKANLGGVIDEDTICRCFIAGYGIALTLRCGKLWYKGEGFCGFFGEGRTECVAGASVGAYRLR